MACAVWRQACVVGQKFDSFLFLFSLVVFLLLESLNTKIGTLFILGYSVISAIMIVRSKEKTAIYDKLFDTRVYPGKPNQQTCHNTSLVRMAVIIVSLAVLWIGFIILIKNCGRLFELVSIYG
jgi:hypothetical protein